MHKWEPDIYIGFSPALHLQCGGGSGRTPYCTHVFGEYILRNVRQDAFFPREDQLFWRHCFWRHGGGPEPTLRKRASRCFFSMCRAFYGSEPVLLLDLLEHAWQRHGALQSRRRKILLRESSANCRYLKKLTCKGTLRRLFICLRPPPLPWPPPLHTVYMCIQYTYSHMEGGELTREKVRGATVHKVGSKIPTWLTVSLVYKLQ
jgi:hypothetical protein